MWKIDFQYKKHLDIINSICTNENMNYIISCSNDKTIGFLNLETKQFDILIGHQDKINCIRLSNDEKIFASCSSDLTIKLWNINSKENFSTLKSHVGSVNSLCWMNNNNDLISSSNDGTAIIWSAERCERILILNALKGWAKDVKSYDNLIAICGNEKFIPFFDKRTGKSIFKLFTNTNADQNCLSFHNSGGLIISGGLDHKIRLWDIRNQEIIRKQRVHSDQITSVNFNKNNDDFITTSKDNYIRFWNLRSNDILYSFNNHENGINDSCWTKNGNQFLTVGNDNKIISYYKSYDDKEFNGSDLIVYLEKIQNNLESLSNNIKSLDNRLLIQEEKIQMIKDINQPIIKKLNLN